MYFKNQNSQHKSAICHESPDEFKFQMFTLDFSGGSPFNNQIQIIILIILQNMQNDYSNLNIFQIDDSVGKELGIRGSTLQLGLFGASINSTLMYATVTLK